MSEHITHIAVYEDLARIALSIPEICDAFKTYIQNQYDSGLLGGASRGNSDYAVPILEKYKDDWDSAKSAREVQIKIAYAIGWLDDRFRNSMAIADGACAARSRREEEDDALPSSTTTNEEIARKPRLPNGLRARVRTQTLSCADEHLRYIQFDLWAQQLSCYFGIDHLAHRAADTGFSLAFEAAEANLNPLYTNDNCRVYHHANRLCVLSNFRHHQNPVLRYGYGMNSSF